MMKQIANDVERIGHSMARCKAAQRQATAEAAQKQRQNTEQVTKSQSLTLVKNLVRVSISTVCHIRNIFPGSCFQERTYAGMRIYQLDAASRDASTNETVVQNEQAYMLTQWLEYGVFEAIHLRYLRRMEFLVVSPELNRPRESYSFDLDYPEGENNAMTFSGTRVTTVENTKGQLVKLIRSLIQFSNTLEEVPSERIINMKLWYYDERTPEDWEPKYFHAADPEELSFNREADHDTLRIRIGELRTPHHTLKVRFEGIDTTLDCDTDGDGLGENATNEAAHAKAGGESSDNDESDVDETFDDRPPPRVSRSGGLLKLEAGQAEDGDRENEEEEDNEDNQPQADIDMLSPRKTNEGRDVARALSGMRELSVAESVPEPGFGQPEVPESVGKWVKQQAKPSIKGATAQLRLTEQEAKQYMDELVAAGLLHKNADDHYYHAVEANSCTDRGTAERTIRRYSAGVEQEDKHDDISSPEDSSAGDDDSATQAPLGTMCEDRRSTPNSMPPPPPLERRGDVTQRRTPEGRGTQLEGDFATPPVPSTNSKPEMRPVPEKPQQARMVSIGAKRVLDEDEMSTDEDTTDGSEPIDVFNNQPAGSMGSASTLGYEISLSQASSVARAAKCSLARNPIRQSGRSKRVRVHDAPVSGSSARQ